MSFMNERIENLHILSQDRLITPNALKKKLPLTEKAVSTVYAGHQVIRNILDGRDHRLLAIVGPCSIHEQPSTMEYAGRLKELHDECLDTLYIVMRVYFEKPRTHVGWQGLINDPHLDGSCRIDEGLELARRMLLDMAQMGLPAAGEALDLITPQYIQDLFSWTAIGARTTESQTHRKMASGFTCPVGFKNGTDGSVEIAVNAMRATAQASNFISVNPRGEVAVVRTRGNPHSHLVLRGSRNSPNFDCKSIQQCETLLNSAGLPGNIMIDCSHDNARKQPRQQMAILEDMANQIKLGNRSIMGFMVESHVHEGRQDLPADASKLQYGLSITDACLGWEHTRQSLLQLRKDLQLVLPNRKK